MKIKEFENSLQENKELLNRFNEELGKLTSAGMEKEDALFGAAAALGFELDREEIKAAGDSKDHELSEKELEDVSGGYLWFGDDAPDGHELNCLQFWYSGWVDFYDINKYTYCRNGEGRKHVFGEPFMYDFYLFGGDISCRKCTLCGEIVPVNKRSGDSHK